MNGQHNPDNTASDDNGDLDRAVSRALQAMGWLVGETEADVQSAGPDPEQDETPLPDALLDIEAAFKDSDNKAAQAPPIALASELEADQHLAQAARQGEPIRPEIERIMRQDREAAENEFDQADNGEDIR